MIDFTVANEVIKRNRLSISEVVRRSGLSRETVISTLNGRRNARLDSLEMILDAIGCKLVIVKKENNHE